MTSQQQIDQIDKAIDANRRALMRRIGCDPGMSAHIWQNAWDRCPDLHARERELYLRRYDAQAARNAEIEKAHRAAQRQARRAANKADRVAA